MPKYSPYIFKKEDAEAFARHVGIQTYQKGKNLHFKQCPYCKGRGKANEKTFAIDLTTGTFNCLRESCGARGNMVTLSRDFDFSLGNEVDEYYTPKKSFKKIPTPKEPIIPKPEAIKYLESRCISKKIAEKYEITVQTDKPNILVFPFYDDKGKLQFVKYRKTDYNKEKDSNKEWCMAETKPILFGIKQCNLDNKTLVVNEGQMDSLACAEAGIENAVSVPTGSKGFTWIPYCWDWITKNFDTVIVFGDYEKGYITLLDTISKRFGRLNIKHVKPENYLNCKDANEILMKYGPKQIRKCIDEAIELPVKNVIDMADVNITNPFDREKLKIGIDAVDRFLYGGLPFGFVHILAGKRGQGKSSFGSQIIGQALRQKYNCMIYSGEMTNGDVKSWLYYQIAGVRHIITNNKDGIESWFMSNNTIKSIDAWIKGRCFLFDESNIENEEVDLVNTIEEMIVKHDCRVILLDNLMTAIEIDDKNISTDELTKQKNLCKKLRYLAKKYDVLILLVAHRRKDDASTDINDAVSGSAYITNIAGVTMDYSLPKEQDGEYVRYLKIAKNRVFGRVNLEGIGLGFEEKSKRIYHDKLRDSCYIFDAIWESNELTNVSDTNLGVEIIVEETPFD